MADFDLTIDDAEHALPRLLKTKQNLRLRLYGALLAGDMLSFFLGFEFAGEIREVNWLSPGGVNLAIPFIVIYLFFCFTNQGYSTRALLKTIGTIRSALTAVIMTMAIILTAGFSLHASQMISRLGFAFAITVGTGFVLLSRLLIRSYVRHGHDGALRSELLIIDGDHAVEGYQYSQVVAANALGIEPNLNDPFMMHRLGTLLHSYDKTVISCTPQRRADWALVLKGANVIGEIVVPELLELGGVGIGSYRDVPTLVVARGPLALPSRAQKRALDISFTVPALILLAPLMLLTAIAIRLDSPGPIFFRQNRIGRGNRIFKILKFRSMTVEASDAGGNRSTQRHDDRITRVGRIIRGMSIDELPQLINVLLGDMSLVGPRPHALGSLAGDKLFWEVDRTYWHRHALKPGITGLAQVRGFRGATIVPADLQNRLMADLEYLQGWTLWRDIAILISTVRVVVHRNAY